MRLRSLTGAVTSQSAQGLELFGSDARTEKLWYGELGLGEIVTPGWFISPEMTHWFPKVYAN